MAGTRKKSKCLSLAQIKRQSTGHFFDRETMKYYRGSKTRVRCDRKTGINYVKVEFKGRETWYQFMKKTGVLHPINATRVPLKLRQK